MIKDLDDTIRQLLKEELPIKNNEVEVSFDQPKREWSAKLSRPTINLYLYDVRENNVLRQRQWERLPDGVGGENGGGGYPLGRHKRLPMRVDCYYMLTTWANDPADEHRLLARCLLTLFRFPILPEDRLEGTLRKPPFDIQARLASHDKLTNPAEVWSALDNEMRPSVSYVVTLALDPWKEQIATSPLVLTREVRTEQSKEISGTVRDDDGRPLPGVEVRVQEKRLRTQTDAEGRYSFPILARGAHTFVVQVPGRRPHPCKIKVPAEGYDLEVRGGEAETGNVKREA